MVWRHEALNSSASPSSNLHWFFCYSNMGKISCNWTML